MAKSAIHLPGTCRFGSANSEARAGVVIGQFAFEEAVIVRERAVGDGQAVSECNGDSRELFDQHCPLDPGQFGATLEQYTRSVEVARVLHPGKLFETGGSQ